MYLKKIKRKENMQNKRLTLNAEKRKAIENVFQSHWEREDSPVIQEWQDAKNTYDTMKPKILELANNVVSCLLYTSDRCRRIERCRSRWSPYH